MRFLLFILPLLFTVSIAHAQENMMAIKSPYSVDKTLDRFETAAKAKGLTIFTRIEHSKNIAGVGMKIRPTSLLIFGNPKIGAKIMGKNQTAGIDLPMKAIAWEDENKQVWLAYNRPYTVMQRHHISDLQELTVKMATTLKSLAAIAVSSIK